jgi:hypothetical protein
MHVMTKSKTRAIVAVICAAVGSLVCTGSALGQETNPSVEAAPLSAREAAFVKAVSGTRFVGRFTMLDADLGQTSDEEYTIKQLEKIGDGRMWRFTTRIRYGQLDLELPLELPVEWAGETPVISLTDVAIPGLGTFSARVLIHEGKYAGTWRHDEKGGHLFGVIKPLE